MVAIVKGAFESQAHGDALIAIRRYAVACARRRSIPDPLPEESMRLQAGRAAYIATRLRTPGLLVLNDPVGTGKTIVALAAATVLMEAPPGSDARVDKVIVVAPNTSVARLWTERQDMMAIGSDGRRPGGGGRSTRMRIVTMSQLAGASGIVPRGDRSRVLIIVDEAHRGLHNESSTAYTALSPIARGARVLLVTATPFQLKPSGLKTMLEIDGRVEMGERIRVYGQAVAQWLTAKHQADPWLSESGNAESQAEISAAAARMASALAKARPDLELLLMPAFDRAGMGMPEAYELPHPLLVPLEDSWASAYHAARLLPEVVGLDPHAGGNAGRNSDSYMRMLNSSTAAWQDSAVYMAARESESKAVTGLLTEITRLMGPKPLGHPKVRRTAEVALAKASRGAGRHVLVFCVFKETQSELAAAIEKLARESGFNVRVGSPDQLPKANHWLRAGFGEPASRSNVPVVLVVRDNLSESIDLDGGRPAVIHHDLSWSPVRWTQRMGRVVRAATGFKGPNANDIVVPVLDTAIDRRMWASLRERSKLTALALPQNPELRDYLESTLPDWDGGRLDGQ